MFQKKVVLVVSCISFFSNALAETTPGSNHLIAYRSGELMAELTFEAWIQVAKKSKDDVIELAKKITQVGTEYSTPPNEYFLQGYLSGLESKNVVTQFEEAQLDRFQCTLVLACHYYWILQLMNALQAHDVSFLPNAYYKQQALEKATIALYGEIVSEIIKELESALEHDHLGLGQYHF